MSDREQAVTNRIQSLHIKGFRSLADLQLDDIPNPMVLLGPNGAGKSNVLRFVQLLRALSRRGLGEFVQQRGGASDQLFGGHQRTERIEAEVSFRTGLSNNLLGFHLKRVERDHFMFVNEAFHAHAHDALDGLNYGPYRADWESGFALTAGFKGADDRSKAAVRFLRDCMVYQFHDTSTTSPLKTRWDAEDGHRLLEHGGNLAPVLIRLRENDLPRYNMICRHIPRVLPEFGGFELDVDYGKTLLRWRAKTTDQTIGAHLTSDGSLRAMSLITLLNLPGELLPNVILLDEPELGLHPSAVTLVAEMVKSMALRRQVVVATQSPIFVDLFTPQEIVVLELDEGQTVVRRPSEVDLAEWLEEYTIGEIWRKNLIGGRP